MTLSSTVVRPNKAQHELRVYEIAAQPPRHQPAASCPSCAHARGGRLFSNEFLAGDDFHFLLAVLILSGRALASDWVKREWTHAREKGKHVSPVLADPTIRDSDLPTWIRRADVYDISKPEGWRMRVRVLEGPGETRRVPKLKQAVLSAGSDATVGITTALQGAGGYGKTTLANALCRDLDIRFEFTDGILRVEIGKERSDVIGLVVDLIEKLDSEGRRPGFLNVQTASEHLGELIGEARLLLVIDDVWREAQLNPFL